MKNREKFDAMKAVYCYYFPEVRPLMREVEAAVPDETFLVTTPRDEVYEKILPLFNPPLEIPSTPEGYVDVDTAHVPVIDRIMDAYSSAVPALREFRHAYPTAGSSEGLFHLLTKLAVRGEKKIHVLDGEYEGYEIQARNLGIEAVHHGRENYFHDLGSMDPGTWFVSNPSAADGNILPEDLIRDLCASGQSVVVDLSYAGSTRPHEFDVSDGNISAVVMSFSKPYGVFRFRVGGLAFSREDMPTLYGNKWFKDYTRLLQGLKLAEEIGPSGLVERYEPARQRIISGINEDFGLGIRPSDALLLGHIREKDAETLDAYQRELIGPYRRGAGYRFCLTKYFERLEKEMKT